MKDFNQIVSSLDAKALEILNSALKNASNSQERLLDISTIQGKINQYNSYLKIIGLFMGLLLCVTVCTFLFEKSFFIELAPSDFSWLGSLLLVLYPFYYLLRVKIGKLQRALYLRKIKSHLEEVVNPNI